MKKLVVAILLAVVAYSVVQHLKAHKLWKDILAEIPTPGDELS